MKFEELLLQRSEEHQKRLALQEEVNKLEAELEGEETVRCVLECALNGSTMPRLSFLLPPPIESLLSELGMVEEEIKQLEGKLNELKLDLYQERAHSKEILQLRRGNKDDFNNNINGNQQLSTSPNPIHYELLEKETRASLSILDRRSLASTSNRGERDIGEISRRVKSGSNRGSGRVKPNELSEQIVKCLISIFLELNKNTSSSLDKQGSSKKGQYKSRPFLWNLNSSNFDPYGILAESDESIRDIGPYKNFIQLTTSSLDITRFPECCTGIRKLRVLIHKLSEVDLTLLRYKQKLAFWINIYNASIMHAFLEHGLPSTQEKLLTLMNKATFNVGGIVLNALAIEHFILRYPSESKHSGGYEKEMIVREAYGVGYPEPNVTFALCRGTWSSPALRVYTAENIVNEMEKAKVDYLEASVGVSVNKSKKMILLPKLLQWQIADFAADMESLVEWIYSQLPRSGSLKRVMMECLNGCDPVSKMVQLQPYHSDFRYLLMLPTS